MRGGSAQPKGGILVGSPACSPPTPTNPWQIVFTLNESTCSSHRSDHHLVVESTRVLDPSHVHSRMPTSSLSITHVSKGSIVFLVYMPFLCTSSSSPFLTRDHWRIGIEGAFYFAGDTLVWYCGCDNFLNCFHLEMY